MNVKINNVLYEDVQWNGYTLTLPGTMTLEEADAAFQPGSEADVISIYEGSEETQRYYNRGVTAMRVTQYEGQPRQIEVDFTTTQINKPAEEALQEGMDDQAGAIMDLAEMFAELENYKVRWNSMADVIDAHARILQQYVDTMDQLMSTNGPLVLLEDRVNELAARLPKSGLEDVLDELEHVHVPTSEDAGTLGTHDEEGNPIDPEAPIEADGSVSEEEE